MTGTARAPRRAVLGVDIGTGSSKGVLLTDEFGEPLRPAILYGVDTRAGARLAWSDAVAGVVTESAAADTGLPVGIPVTAGTVDAWAEAISVDSHHPGDLMLMYGTTMFLVCTVAKPLSAPPLWGTVGAFEGTHNLAGGMATSGAITSWLKDLLDAGDYSDLAGAVGHPDRSRAKRQRSKTDT